MSTFFHTFNPASPAASLASCSLCGQHFPSQALLRCHLLEDVHAHRPSPEQIEPAPLAPLSLLSLPPPVSLAVTGSVSADTLAPLRLTRARHHGSDGDNTSSNTATNRSSQHLLAAGDTSSHTILSTLTSTATSKTHACQVCDQRFRSKAKLEAHKIEVPHHPPPPPHPGHHPRSHARPGHPPPPPPPPPHPSEDAKLSSKQEKAKASRKVKQEQAGQGQEQEQEQEQERDVLTTSFFRAFNPLPDGRTKSHQCQTCGSRFHSKALLTAHAFKDGHGT